MNRVLLSRNSQPYGVNRHLSKQGSKLCGWKEEQCQPPVKVGFCLELRMGGQRMVKSRHCHQMRSPGDGRALALISSQMLEKSPYLTYLGFSFICDIKIIIIDLYRRLNKIIFIKHLAQLLAPGKC